MSDETKRYEVVVTHRRTYVVEARDRADVRVTYPDLDELYGDAGIDPALISHAITVKPLDGQDGRPTDLRVTWEPAVERGDGGGPK